MHELHFLLTGVATWHYNSWRHQGRTTQFPVCPGGDNC